MATIKQFEDLEIWQLARAFANEVFETYSASILFEKDYKLKDQINSSTGSIMDNIAEGFERAGRNEFINFLSLAKGSAGESKSQLYRALDRKYITQAMFFDTLYLKADEISRKIGALMNYLNKSSHKGTKFKDRTTPNNPRP